MNQDQEWGLEEEKPGFDPLAQVLAIAQDPIGALQRRWLWMVIVLVVGLAGTAFVTSTTVPIYEAEATVLISGQQIPEHFVRSTVIGDSLANVNAMVGEVLSQRNLSALVEKHGLYAELREKSTMLAIVARMRNRISIEQVDPIRKERGSTQQLFRVIYTDENPNSASDVTNELASSFVEASLETRHEQARLTTEFLRRELDRAEQELREANRKITEFQRSYRGELPSDLEPHLRKLERLAQQRDMLHRQVAAGQQTERDLAQLGPGGVASSDTVLSHLRQRLAAELGVNTEEHPNVIGLREQIALMEGTKSSGSSSIVNSERDFQVRQIRRDVETWRSELARIDREVAVLDERVDRIPARQEELTALEENTQVIRDTYLDFRRKVDEAELAQTLESAQQGPRVSVLDRAQPPSGPTSPRWLSLIIGLVATLGGTVGIAVLLELLDPVVISEMQLSGLAGAPLLGAVPRG